MHLHLISRAASQRLGILRKSWRVFHDRLLREMLSSFCPACFEVLFCIKVLGWRYTPKLLNCVVSGAFLKLWVWVIVHIVDVCMSVLCTMYMIRCNPVHPLHGALPVPNMPVRVTRGALVAHRYTYG